MSDSDFGDVISRKDTHFTLLSAVGAVLIVLVAVFLFYGYAVYRKGVGEAPRAPLVPSVYSGDVVDRTAENEPLVRPTALPEVVDSDESKIEEKESWWRRLFGGAPKGSGLANNNLPTAISPDAAYALYNPDVSLARSGEQSDSEQTHGIVLDVDSERRQVRIAFDGTTSQSVFVGPVTRLTKNGSPATFEDILVNDRVAVAWHAVGAADMASMTIADTLDILGPPSIPPAGL